MLGEQKLEATNQTHAIRGFVSGSAPPTLPLWPNQSKSWPNYCRHCVAHWYHWYESTFTSFFFALMGHGCITLAATGTTRDGVRALCSGWVGRFIFRSCLWRAETDQNRWAEVFSLPFPLLWVNTCLQVTVEGALSNTKSQFISRDGMLLPSLCCIHGKVLSRGPSGLVIVRPKLFYPSNYFCFLSIHLLSTTITRSFGTCFKFPTTSNPDNWNKCIF